MSGFTEWESFYLIVGGSAGALIGLQFVVMALIAERPPQHVAEGGAAFITPTIVHFGAVLLLSALVRVPWPTITWPAVLWGLMGFGGVVYSLIVVKRLKKQSIYRPGFEDWLFHAVMPLVAYAMLALSAFATDAYMRGALFAVGGASLLLLFAGIHNAWDAVAYHVFVNIRGEKPGVRRRR